MEEKSCFLLFHILTSDMAVLEPQTDSRERERERERKAAEAEAEVAFTIDAKGACLWIIPARRAISSISIFIFLPFAGSFSLAGEDC